jgi:hypothetical protein
LSQLRSSSTCIVAEYVPDFHHDDMSQTL